MKKLIFILLALCIIGGVGYSQVPVKRKKKDKTEQPQSSDNRRKQEAEAKRKQEEEARRQREAEAKRKQEEEARQQREAEAKRKQEEEARQQREAETKRKQEEEARLQREAEAKRKQEEEARQQREAETKRNETGMINGHEWVDLGLPSGLKWATTNIGATSPSDYGNYYAWGETATKSSYTDDNSLTYGKSIFQLRTAGIIGTSGILTMPHDAARSNWGGSWRMPTKEECQELLDKCTWTWTSQGGHNGYKVTGPNGRSIFVPAAGWRNGTSIRSAGEYGIFWSSALSEENTGLACGLYFSSYRRGVGWSRCYDGQTVRPVSE